MKNYADWDNDSGIEAYENGFGYIIVKFKKGRYRFYKYTVNSAGHAHITNMQRLAESGDGLNAYIKNNDVNYESQW